jgi:hypothetical protein
VSRSFQSRNLLEFSKQDRVINVAELTLAWDLRPIKGW